MFDIRFDNVSIIDGTGCDAYVGSVAVADGKIAAVGSFDGSAAEVIDGRGLCLMPGIIDNHTHYDAQVTWDPYLNPSPQLGVTTVVMGNCGFAIAPCRPNDQDLTMRNLTQVEGMSLDSLRSGIEWNFETFPQYLSALADRGVGPNVACFAGHSSIRTYVMGEDASKRSATSEEVRQMRALVVDAMEAGAVGFASTRSYAHNGENGIPMPSRLADDHEMLTLSAALGDVGRGVLMMTKASDTPISWIERLSVAADRPYLIAPLLHSQVDPDKTFKELADIGIARARGSRLYGAVSPCPLNMDFSFLSPYPLEGYATWNPLMSLDKDAYKRALADPAFRKSFIDEMNDGQVRTFSGQWDKVQVAQVASNSNALLEGKSIAEIATGLGSEPFDVMLDLALEEDLETVFTATVMNGDEDAVGRMMCDEHAILSLSDAGAHLTFLCDAGFGLHVLGYWVRDKKLMSIERAVYKLTYESAILFGIQDRGKIVEGAWADLLLFDANTVGRGATTRVYDLPAGASRLTTPASGVHGVWVNGARMADTSGLIGDAPLRGQVLRDFTSA